jgi:hypothetical protein
MVCSMSRKPARERRETPLSSCEVCGATTPTGKPDAPEAGSLPASSTVTCQPRSAKARAVPAPAMPDPMMVTLRSLNVARSAGVWQGPVVCARSTSANSGQSACGPTHSVSERRAWVRRSVLGCVLWGVSLFSANRKRCMPGSKPQHCSASC